MTPEEFADMLFNQWNTSKQGQQNDPKIKRSHAYFDLLSRLIMNNENLQTKISLVTYNRISHCLTVLLKKHVAWDMKLLTREELQEQGKLRGDISSS